MALESCLRLKRVTESTQRCLVVSSGVNCMCLYVYVSISVKWSMCLYVSVSVKWRCLVVSSGLNCMCLYVYVSVSVTDFVCLYALYLYVTDFVCLNASSLFITTAKSSSLYIHRRNYKSSPLFKHNNEKLIFCPSNNKASNHLS